MTLPDGMTWYDVLDVLTTARHEDVRRCYEAKCRQVGPGQIAGAPSEVIAAAEQSNNIVHWNEFDRGGHFAVMEQPGLLTGDIRDFFRQLR